MAEETEKDLAEKDEKEKMAEDSEKEKMAEEEDEEKMMEKKSYAMSEGSALLLAEVTSLREQLTALREENDSVKRSGAVDSSSGPAASLPLSVPSRRRGITQERRLRFLADVLRARVWLRCPLFGGRPRRIRRADQP